MEKQLMKDCLRFRLEFMLMMHMAGREEEANKMLVRLFEAIDKVEGYYTPEPEVSKNQKIVNGMKWNDIK